MDSQEPIPDGVGDDSVKTSGPELTRTVLPGKY
jgi:hypothetical protein